MNIVQLLIIAAGGAVGAVTRFLVARGIYAVLGAGFPYGTLFINVTGSFLMGFLTELMLQRFALLVEFRAAVLVGFLGAYTTFSTFSLETLYLFEEGGYFKAGVNVLLSVSLCLGACWVGLILGRLCFSEITYPGIEALSVYWRLLPALLTVFLLSFLLEFCFQRMLISPQIKLAGFVLMLSLISMLSTLSIVFNPAGFKVDFSSVLSVFIITTLIGALMIWLGSKVGNGLWQLKLLQ